MDIFLGSNRLGYDLSTSQFSPEGRIFQVEYAQKAISNSGTAIGMRGKDGVVFAVENFYSSKLYESHGNSRIFTVDYCIGAAVAGFMGDARHIVSMARENARNYRSEFHQAPPLNHIKNSLGMYMQATTQYAIIRPFGASIILGAYECGEGKLYCIDPSGVALGYFGCAIGKASDDAMSEMEDIDLENMAMRNLIKEATRVIYMVHDDETDFTLELSYVGNETGGRHELVPRHLLREAEVYAMSAMLEENIG